MGRWPAMPDDCCGDGCCDSRDWWRAAAVAAVTLAAGLLVAWLAGASQLVSRSEAQQISARGHAIIEQRVAFGEKRLDCLQQQVDRLVASQMELTAAQTRLTAQIEALIDRLDDGQLRGDIDSAGGWRSSSDETAARIR